MSPKKDTQKSSGFSAEDKLASDLNDTYQETGSLKVVDDLRTSLIVVVTITLFISLAVYGASGNFNLSG